MENNTKRKRTTDKETAAEIQKVYKKNYQIIIKEDLTDLNPATIGEAELPAYRATAIRNQVYSFLYRSCSGCGQLLLNGRRFPVKEGDFFIVPVGTSASLYCEEPWSYTWIGFTGIRASEFFSFPTVFTLPDSTVAQLYDLRSPERNLASRLTSDLFLIHSKLRAPRQNDPDYIQRIVNKINASYMQKLSVSQMAQELGINRSHLSRVFKSRMGESIQEYILRVRLAEARRHLLAGFSVTETAQLCGFGDRSTFSRIFSRETGYSPHEWRDLSEKHPANRPR
ncbi:MAG: AraC family transcriptional regulator [Oscillospiraceae bacterium]|nr:AraC family transcriptional regulator [Oscillospiraceae bacterium]